MLLCRLALGEAQLITPEGDTGGFTAFQTLGSCFIDLRYFSVGPHIGGWCSQATVALRQGQSVGFAGCLGCSSQVHAVPLWDSTAISRRIIPQGSGFLGLVNNFIQSPEARISQAFFEGFLFDFIVVYWVWFFFFPVLTAVRLQAPAESGSPASHSCISLFVPAQAFVCSQLCTDLGTGLV